MTRLRLHRLCFLLLTAALPVITGAIGTTRATQEPARLRLETLAEGVFAFLPTEEAFDTWSAISNSGAVLLDDGVLLFDSHWTPALAREALGLLREHTDLPVRYVVSSHFHGDHTGGTWAYDEGVVFVSHQATRQRLIDEAPDLPRQLRAQIAQQEASLETLEPVQRVRTANFLRANRELLERLEGPRAAPLPTLTFERSLCLHRGRRVELHFLGRGHTDGDVVLHLPDERIAFVGDLLFTRTLPNTGDGHTGHWYRTLEGVLALGARRYVPGHGPLSGPQDVRDLRAYFAWLHEEVRPYVEAGWSVEEAQAGIAMPERYAGHAFGFFLAVNVASVHAELSADASADASAGR